MTFFRSLLIFFALSLLGGAFAQNAPTQDDPALDTHALTEQLKTLTQTRAQRKNQFLDNARQQVLRATQNPGRQAISRLIASGRWSSRAAAAEPTNFPSGKRITPTWDRARKSSWRAICTCAISQSRSSARRWTPPGRYCRMCGRIWTCCKSRGIRSIESERAMAARDQMLAGLPRPYSARAWIKAGPRRLWEWDRILEASRIGAFLPRLRGNSREGRPRLPAQ